MCDSNGFDDGVRDALRWDSPRGLRLASDITLSLLPVTMLGLSAVEASDTGGMKKWATDTVIMLEAIAVCQALNQLVKFPGGRERPFVRALPDIVLR